MKLNLYLLATALLDQSSRDFVGLKPRDLREYKAHVQAEAAEWFESKSVETGSYLWCCRATGVDPDEFRAGMEARTL